VLLGIAALVILMSQDYVAKMHRFQGEYYALVLIATAGMMLMAATTNLIAIYVSLELASITLYALTGFLKNDRSAEAALKYLLIGAVASATLLYGMALVFGVTGSTQLADIAAAVATGAAASPALLLGMVLLIAGFGFKIAAVPFHMWVPDVYEGAPTTITAFLSVASKAAGFALVLRIKRLLGYSSIAQAGYIMVGVATVGVAGGSLGQSGVLFFLAAYALTNLGAFIAIIAITNKVKSDVIADFTGMVKRAPVLTLGLTLCLISLIGLPPAGGFLAKFYIFSSAVQGGLLWLVIVAVINSVISAVYYLKVAKVMWLGEPASADKVASSWALRAAMIISCAGVLVLGIVPGWLMRLAEVSTTVFSIF